MSNKCPACHSDSDSFLAPTGSIHSGNSVIALDTTDFDGGVHVMGHYLQMSARLNDVERGDLIHALHEFWDLAYRIGRAESAQRKDAAE